MFKLTCALSLLAVVSVAQTAAPVVSINCGGASYTAADGTPWLADRYFDGGDLSYTGSNISGTKDLTLYRSARRGLYGDFTYTIPLSDGSYRLRLMFAEISYTKAGQRVFNVNANGAALLTSFDVLAEVPPFTADDKQFDVTVANGALRIDVIGVVGRGLLNGIQIFSTGTPPGSPVLSLSGAALSFSAGAGGANPAAQPIAISNPGGGTLAWNAASNQKWLTVSPASGSGPGNLAVSVDLSGLQTGTYSGSITVTAPGAAGSPKTVDVTLTVTAQPPTPPRPTVSINCGGAAFTGADGTEWSADQYYSGGDLAYNGAPIDGTVDTYLYRSARRGLYDNFSYTIPTANGAYTLVLKFAEIAYTAPGKRVFNVLVNGTAVLTNFDILAEVPPLTADDKRIPVTVTTGQLRIDVNGVTGFGLLNAIQLLPAGATPPPQIPSLSVSPAALNFGATAGGANPVAQTVRISNTGAGVLNWTASNTQPWLHLPASGGSGGSTVAIQPSIAGLNPGTYTDTITIGAPGASPAGATVGVTLTILPATPPPPPPPPPTTGGNTANTDQWAPNPNPPQPVDPNGGPVLYNGIQLPAAWPPLNGPTQQYAAPPYLVNRPAVVPIDVGRQLFVDDFLIDQTNLTRVQHQPVLYSGNPVVTPNTQGMDFQKNLALVYSDGVWFDPADHLFKMWYDGGYGNNLSYAISTDGLAWTKPKLSDAVIPNTNIVLQLGGGRDSTTVWMDLHDDPSRKFKLFAYFPNNNGYYLGIYFSPDGIHWSARQPYTPNSLSDRTTVFYNPFRSVWVESARNSADVPATSSRPADTIRSRFYSESANLQTWSPSNPQKSFWLSRDDRDPAYPGSKQPPELYTLDGTPYESVMVGLFSWYYPPDGPDLVELGIGFSRDGFHWSRPTRGGGPANAFIAASNQANTWNTGNTQSAGGGFLVVGDQLYIYFSGRNSYHSQENANTLRSTGVAMLRRDGFYSMAAGADEGTLTTHPLRFSGSHLFVNVADPNGRLQVEVLDADDNVIPQFSRSNSAVLTADNTRAEITWSGANLGSLAGETVRFKFYLTNGELYSFWVTPSASGASNGYVAAGGPGFTSDVDR